MSEPDGHPRLKAHAQETALIPVGVLVSVAELVILCPVVLPIVGQAVRLVLGMIIVCRASKEDLPEITSGLARWLSFWGRK